jgi:hypothetical protein
MAEKGMKMTGFGFAAVVAGALLSGGAGCPVATGYSVAGAPTITGGVDHLVWLDQIQHSPHPEPPKVDNSVRHSR